MKFRLSAAAAVALFAVACAPPPTYPPPTTAPPTTVAPVLSVALSPNPALTNTTLSCVPTGVPDGNSLTYRWEVNATQVSWSSSALPASFFSRSNSVTCRVTAFPSDQTASATTVIANSPPVITSVTVSPANPTTSDNLTCSASATDADFDPVSVSYVWSGSVGGPEFPAGIASPGDEVTCTAVAFDGIDESAPSNATVVIQG